MSLTFSPYRNFCTTFSPLGISRAGGAGVRSMIVGLGSGTGIGITYAEARRDFEELAPRKSEAAKDKS